MITKAPGIEDIFPDRIDRWNHIIQSTMQVFNRYNYREIVLPVLEFTDLFSRGIGGETDIVSKEMFTFEDRGGRSLTLRPEGTAGCVRAYIENGDFNRLSICKVFYAGPMFRAEKPQKGRLRQFSQIGAEVFGSDDPWHDAEMIAMAHAAAKECGVASFTLLLNSIGCDDCRPAYITKLKKYFSPHMAALCPDCLKRFETNTLRLLDCKVENCKTLHKDAPVINAHLCEPCNTHYQAVKGHLNTLAIPFTEDPGLVRGLDYYTRTTFEFTAPNLGSQSTFAAGGRYNKLVELLGGKPTPAVGYAMGIERVYISIEESEIPERRLDAWIVYTGDDARTKALCITDELRHADLSADVDPSGTGMKSQMKKAEREKTRYSVIIGGDEIAGGYASVKNMDTGEQEKIPFGDIAAAIRK